MGYTIKGGFNSAENANRPFVVGRKICLFAGNLKGAKASAEIFSLIESAKANGLEPYRFLQHLFAPPLLKRRGDTKLCCQ